MEAITRDAFVAKFYISVQVRNLRSWSKRQKEPPYFLSTTIYETMCICGAEFPIDARAFGRLVHPVIDDLFHVTPRGRIPEAPDTVGRIYDALDAAGVEVTFRPPLEAHGSPHDSRRHQG